MLLNSIPNSNPHISLYSSKCIFKNILRLQDQEKCSTNTLVGRCHFIQEKKNIQETILLQPFIEKIYTIESSES